MPLHNHDLEHTMHDLDDASQRVANTRSRLPDEDRTYQEFEPSGNSRLEEIANRIKSVLGIEMTRRQFLRGPVDFVQNLYDSVRNMNGGESALGNSFEIAGDAATIIAFILLGFEGSSDKVLTIDLSTETQQRDLKNFHEKTKQVEAVGAILGSTPERVGALRWAWDTYEEETCTTSTDDDGNETKTCTKYWDEPTPLLQRGLNHSQLDEWRHSLDSISNIVSRINNEAGQMFNLRNEASVDYQTGIADVGPQRLETAVLYTGVGLTFAYSEEILDFVAELLREQDGSLDDLAEIVANAIDANSYVARRTVLKGAIAGFFATQIREAQKLFAINSTGILDDTKKKVREVLQLMDIPPEQNFERFFGISPTRLRAMMVDIKAKLSSAVSEVPEYQFESGDVYRKVQELLTSVTQSLDAFDAYFSYDESTGSVVVPELLHEFIMQSWATQEITGYVRSRNAQVYIRHVENAAELLAKLTATTIALEAIGLPITGKIQNLASQFLRKIRI